MSKFIYYNKVQKILNEKQISDHGKSLFLNLLAYANESGGLRDDQGRIFGNVVLANLLEIDLEVFYQYAKELEKAGLLEWREEEKGWGYVKLDLSDLKGENNA